LLSAKACQNESNFSLFVRLRFSGGGGETHSSGQEGMALALQVKIFHSSGQEGLALALQVKIFNP
jgi:hypothetical protein